MKYVVELLYRVEVDAPSEEDAMYYAREIVEETTYLDAIDGPPEPTITVSEADLRSGGL